MTRVPLDPEGYSVDIETGSIHTRYSIHDGRHPRTRTAKGVATLLNGQAGKVCATCYPSPRYATTNPRPPQQRRSGNASALPGV